MTLVPWILALVRMKTRTTRRPSRSRRVAFAKGGFVAPDEPQTEALGRLGTRRDD